MYHQMNGFVKEINEIKQKMDPEATSNSPSAYIAKMKWLKGKWPENKDSTAARLIKPVLYSIAPPLQHAIVADNLDYFSKHYDKTAENSNALLAIACLCGSQNIADFLLGKMELSYTSAGHEYILSYASSSPNIEWAEAIAVSFKKAAKPIPREIYSYADDDTLDRITRIFE